MATDILTYLCYHADEAIGDAVKIGFDNLSNSNAQSSRYEYWFKSFLDTLAGRGKMGSMVGASEDLRRHGGQESTLNDYAVILLEKS